MMAWIWIILALLYILSPYDLLPDFIPVRGWLDDIVVLILLVRYLVRLNKTRFAGSHDSGNRQYQSQGARDDHREKDGSPPNPPKDPYRTLGIPRHADQDEIHAAYRKLANQYHPDKVAHLGREFQELAEKRFKEIQQAYEKIKKS